MMKISLETALDHEDRRIGPLPLIDKNKVP